MYHITYSSTTTLGNHILVKKHHVDGTPPWDATYGNIGPITNNHAVDVKVDASGNVYIVGATKHNTEGYNALVVKYNNMGIKQWDYTYHSNGSDDDIATALDIDGSGNCYITGSTVKTTDKDVFVLKVDNMGNNGFATTYNYDNFDDGGIFIDYVSSSSIEVAAITQDDAGGYQLSKLVYNSTGTLQNSYRTNIGYGNMRINDLKAVGGEYMVCGAVENTNGDWDFAVYSLSSNMTTNWSYIHDENGYDDEANSLVVDGSGNVYATGYVIQSDDLMQLAASKLNSNGSVAWQKEFQHENYGVGSHLDLRGNKLLICGKVYNENRDISTLMLNTADGEALWWRDADLSLNEVGVSCFFTGKLEFAVVGTQEENDNRVLSYKLFMNDTTILEDTTHGDHVDNQLIIRFDNSVLNQTFLNDKNTVFASIDDVLNASGYNALDSMLPDSIETDSLVFSKVFKDLTPNDTMSITRYGDTIPIPPFYQTLLMHLNEPTNVYETSLMFDSIDSTYFDPIQYCEINGVVKLYCNLSNVGTGYDSQPALHAVPGFSNTHIDIEGARCIEVGQEFVRVGILDSKVSKKRPDFKRADNKTKVVYQKDHTGVFNIESGDEHGTHVAGIVGAVANNGGASVVGVAGGDMGESNSGVTLYNPVTGLLENGIPKSLEITKIAPVVLYCAQNNPNNSKQLGLAIMNHSYGNGVLNQDLKDAPKVFTDAFRFAYENGVINVCAKGYNGDKTNGRSALDYPNGFYDDWVITVGATGTDDQPYLNSNYGKNIDLTASGFSAATYNISSEGGYNVVDGGTSFSAPLVTGVAGLLTSYLNNPNNLSDKKNLAPEDVEIILENSCSDVGKTGYDKKTGYGIVNAAQALQLVEKPNFLIEHYHAETWSETVVEENEVVKVREYYFNDEQNENAIPLQKNKKYLMNIHKVEIQIERDWPKGPYQPWGNYSIVNSSTFAEFNEDGWWGLGSRSNLWHYDAANKEVYPYNDITFSVAPHKVTVNGEEKMQATIYGYIFYVHRKNNSNAWMEKWYPHSDEEAHRLAFSVYYTKGWDVGVGKPDTLSLNLFPNPVKNMLNIESNSDIEQIRIYDIMGKVILDIHKPANSIDMSAIKNGMYIVECIDFRSRIKRSKLEVLK